MAGVGLGVLGLIKRLAGKRITSVVREGDVYIISVENSENLQVTVNVFKVFADPGVREGLEKVVAPLHRPGIDTLQFRRKADPPVTVEKKEAKYFENVVLPEKQIGVDSGTAILEVVSPVFREDNSWRFAQGGTSFWAKVADPDFRSRVARRRTTFGTGDALRVDLETRTTRQGGALKATRTITKVHEHIQAEPGSYQASIFPPENPEEG